MLGASEKRAVGAVSLAIYYSREVAHRSKRACGFCRQRSEMALGENRSPFSPVMSVARPFDSYLPFEYYRGAEALNAVPGERRAPLLALKAGEAI